MEGDLEGWSAIIRWNGAAHGSTTEMSLEVLRSVRTRVSPVPHNRFELSNGRALTAIRALESRIPSGSTLHFEKARGLLGGERFSPFFLLYEDRQDVDDLHSRRPAPRQRTG